MTARRLLAFTTVTGALAAAAPVLAQPAPPYEYAEPLPDGSVIYRSEPVIQPLPAPAMPVPPVLSVPPLPEQSWYGEEAYEAEVTAPPPMIMHPPQNHGSALAHHPYAHPLPTYPGYHSAPPAQFDRDRWLLNCRERIRGVRREDRAGVIGGLLGAAVGGVAGNHLWDSERLAGTLLGAGVGGLAGIAIGAAIGAAGDRRREDECAMHLDRYIAGGYPGQGVHPAYSYGYGYGYAYPAMTYVPVLVAVPQRAVIRETVTEEWVDAPAPVRTVTETKIIRQGAPARTTDKRIKRIKGR